MGTTCTKLPKTKAHTQQVNSNSNQQLSPPSSQEEAGKVLNYIVYHAYRYANDCRIIMYIVALYDCSR